MRSAVIRLGRAARGTVPQRHLLSARNAYYRALLRYHEQKNERLGAGHGKWDRIVHVDPAQIQYITCSDPNLEYTHKYLDIGAFDIVERSGAVVGGSWDRQAVEFEELYVYQSLRRRVSEQVPWEETRFFEHVSQEIQDGNDPWGCTSIADLRRRCASIENLYAEIRENGYRSQSELGRVPVDEITVNVGRDGTLFFNDGRHRLAVAKLLQIDAIPVRILVVHEEFESGRLDTDALAPRSASECRQTN